MQMELIRVAYTATGTFGVLLEVDPQITQISPMVSPGAREPFAVTLERPWLDNRASRYGTPGSCIPEGSYRCLRCRRSPDYGYRAATSTTPEVLGSDSPKFGDTFQVYGVPGRTTILFHKGNLEDDTRGCILVGEQFERIGGKPFASPMHSIGAAQGKAGIAASAAGFAEFLRRTAAVEEFALVIRAA